MVGTELTGEENELLLEILFKREGALAWGFEDVGRVRLEVAPPQRMRTLPHEAWQIPGFRVPRALKDTVNMMMKQRMQCSILEHGHGSYRNPWFLVKKKGKEAYRLVNAAIYPYKVTIRDANMPPDADEFVEEFSGMAVASDRFVLRVRPNNSRRKRQRYDSYPDASWAAPPDNLTSGSIQFRGSIRSNHVQDS